MTAAAVHMPANGDDGAAPLFRRRKSLLRKRRPPPPPRPDEEAALPPLLLSSALPPPMPPLAVLPSSSSAWTATTTTTIAPPTSPVVVDFAQHRLLQQNQPATLSPSPATEAPGKSSSGKNSSKTTDTTDFDGTVAIFVVLVAFVCFIALPAFFRACRNRFCLSEEERRNGRRLRYLTDADLERAVMRRLADANLILGGDGRNAGLGGYPSRQFGQGNICMTPEDRQEYIANVLSTKVRELTGERTKYCVNQRLRGFTLAAVFFESNLTFFASPFFSCTIALQKVVLAENYQEGRGDDNEYLIISKHKHSKGNDDGARRSGEVLTAVDISDEKKIDDTAKGRTAVVEEGDTERDDDDDNDDDEHCCTICLVEYEDGDEVCQSNNQYCRHYFHRECTYILCRGLPRLIEVAL